MREYRDVQILCKWGRTIQQFRLSESECSGLLNYRGSRCYPIGFNFENDIATAEQHINRIPRIKLMLRYAVRAVIA